ncbi:MAG: hypothetical protein IJV08_00105 [Bacteroidaceae bacterium]|nr:hypothetical protein [Bacteroidaceae bacterium]
MKIRAPKIYLLRKETLVRSCFHWGIFIAYLGSLYPWFMWKLGGAYQVLSAILLMGALMLAKTMKAPFYTRRDFLLPIVGYLLLSYYQMLVNGNNAMAYIANAFSIAIFFSLFTVGREELSRLANFLSKVMGAMVLVSMSMFFLYLMGFPLPHTSAQFMDGFYSFDNYYFFMLDDRFLWVIIPRFQSVFLEPNHLGTATTLLLFTQYGKWKRWYNISMIVATLISFSLGAYVLLAAVVILHLWMRRKHFIGKLILVLSLFAGIVTASFFYNGGENMFHDLIVLRMEMDDGELVQDSRVNASFEAEYDNFIQTPDILWGRDMSNVDEEGNSGYKVYIYENGLVGLLFVIVFYVVSWRRYCDRRFFLATWAIAILAFIARGYPIWYNYYIPFYCVAMALPLAESKKGLDAAGVGEVESEIAKSES